MTKRKFKRRMMLRGLAAGSAATLALPLFDREFNDNGTAMADGGEIPRRFGIFFWGNGVIPERWTPSATGADWELSDQLQPLADVKDYLNIVTGTDIKTGTPRGHHAGCVGFLSGAPLAERDHAEGSYASTFTVPSIDQVLARRIGVDTAFPSVEYGIFDNVTTGEGSTLRYLSHNGEDDFNPPKYSPRELFEQLFGDTFRAPDEAPTIDPRIGLRRSVLDAVMADANDLKMRLGTNDQRRLDQHLTGIRELERRLMRLENTDPQPYLAACERPTDPGMPEYADNELKPKNKLMSDIMAMGLACDQTRVFSNLFSGSVGGTRFPGTSIRHHSNTHDEGDPWAEVHTATLYIMDCLKDLLVSLRDIEEGGESLLDHTVVLASSDLSWDHRVTDYPIIVAGGGCGSIRTPGVHYRGSGENTSQVLLTAMRAADPTLEEAGSGAGHVTETIGAIEG